MCTFSECSESRVVPQGPGSCREPGFLDQYEVLRAIGHGHFGQVHLARHRLTGARVAVKVLKKVAQDIPVLSEPVLLGRLEHPNVVQLFQVIGTQDKLYMVMEYAGGEQLLQHIPRGGMQEEEARSIFRQIVSAVGYCHDQGVVHRDLKPQNIMVDARGHVKLIDFGVGSRFTAGQKLTNFWGSLPYLAPEVVLQQAYEGPPADIWSLGVILYFMLTGSRPFGGPSDLEMLSRIVQARYQVPSSVPVQAGRLIRQILVVNPKMRLPLKRILRHPWLRHCKPRVPQPSSEAPPRRPDPAILTILFDMGFDPYQTWLSLAQRKFDAAMATYLVLKHQQDQGLRCVFRGKPVPPWLRTRSCPVDRLDVPVLPRRSASEPALRTFPLADACSGLTSSCQSHPGVHMPHTSRVCPRCPRTDRSSCSHQDRSPGQGPGRHSAWKRVRRRVAACILSLCCCLPRVSNKVAPMPQRRRVPHP